MTTGPEASAPRHADVAGAQHELTVDELAARVGMTVRNVRAYSSRGLLPPPRLVGRTGYYGAEHVQRLHLVRELLDRGYTLSAVERAVSSAVPATFGHTLDLLQVLGHPVLEQEPPEVVTRDALAAMVGTSRGDLFDRLCALGLAERNDDEHLMLLQPTVVRAGAQAIALGLDDDAVLDLLPRVSEHLQAVAQLFVREVRTSVWRPFVESGMPEDSWADVLHLIETLLPVAGQAVISIFRQELGVAVREAMGEELVTLTEEQPSDG